MSLAALPVGKRSGAHWLCSGLRVEVAPLCPCLCDRVAVLLSCVRRWQIKGLTGLNEEAAEALDFVCNLPERLR